MKLENNICKFLEWDSNFFNVRIANLVPETLTYQVINSAISWCLENKIDCLYFLANPGDGQTIKLTEEHNFKLTDIRVTLEIEFDKSFSFNKNQNNSIKVATIEDVEQLRTIAAVNHHDSRFYYDEHFSRQKCNELFAIWIEKSCKGYADIVLLAKTGNTVQGYITCSIDDNSKGSIGLLGVSPVYQGKGVGKLLVCAALEWFRNHNIFNVSVVTQGRNIKAQRLYQRNMFVTKSIKIWYHKWY